MHLTDEHPAFQQSAAFPSKYPEQPRTRPKPSDRAPRTRVTSENPGDTMDVPCLFRTCRTWFADALLGPWMLCPVPGSPGFPYLVLGPWMSRTWFGGCPVPGLLVRWMSRTWFVPLVESWRADSTPKRSAGGLPEQPSCNEDDDEAGKPPNWRGRQPARPDATAQLPAREYRDRQQQIVQLP